jgi:N-acetylglucosamine malate deacetylase 1
VTTASTRGQTTLAFSPHPDDVEFGMGGTLLALRDAGVDVHVIVVTDGAGLASASASERYAEQELASGVGGYKSHYIGLQDGAVDVTSHNVEVFRDLVVGLSPTVVFAPFPFREATDFRSSHPDHENTGLLVREALLRARVPDSSGRYWRTDALYYYYLPSGVRPALAVDVSKVMEELPRLLQCFKSQTSRPKRSVDNLMAKRKANQVGMEGVPSELFAAEGPLLAGVTQLFRT